MLRTIPAYVLESLCQIHKLTTEEVLGKLRANGFKSDETLLLSSLQEICDKTRFSSDFINELRNTLLVYSVPTHSTHPSSTHAHSYHNQYHYIIGTEIQEHQAFTTGLSQLDHLLARHHYHHSPGGLYGITALSGPAASGKTQLCMQITLSAIQQHHRVLWIDAGINWSWERFKAMLHLKSRDPHSGGVPSNNLEQLVSRIELHRVKDIWHCLGVLNTHLSSSNGSTNRESSSDKPSLIIIDSIASLLSPLVGSCNQGYVLMQQLGLLLKSFWSRCGVPSILVNGAVTSRNTAISGTTTTTTTNTISEPATNLKPALGMTFAQLPHLTLWIWSTESLETKLVQVPPRMHSFEQEEEISDQPGTNKMKTKVKTKHTDTRRLLGIWKGDRIEDVVNVRIHDSGVEVHAFLEGARTC